MRFEYWETPCPIAGKIKFEIPTKVSQNQLLALANSRSRYMNCRGNESFPAKQTNSQQHLEFELPKALEGRHWEVVMDTTWEQARAPMAVEHKYLAGARSIAILEAKP